MLCRSRWCILAAAFRCSRLIRQSTIRCQSRSTRTTSIASILGCRAVRKEQELPLVSWHETITSASDMHVVVECCMPSTGYIFTNLEREWCLRASRPRAMPETLNPFSTCNFRLFSGSATKSTVIHSPWQTQADSLGDEQGKKAMSGNPTRGIPSQ